MDFSRQTSLARQRFYQEIDQPPDQIDLAKAALYLAQEEYPDLDVEEYLSALDAMAVEVRERLPRESYPLRIIQTLNQYFYEDLQFQGNTDSYYDPRNSYLNDVIDRRMGIPITLSLVYLEVAGRIDFPMVGVGMPGHFLIRPIGKDMQIFVDPFHQGEVLFEQDCQERLSQTYGRPMAMRPEFLDAVSPHYFLARILTNLKGVYLKQTDWLRAIAAIDRILLLLPHSWMEQRDRGLLYYQLERWAEARQDLEDYLTCAPSTVADAPRIRDLLRRIEGQ
ncbi:MAG: tetratricopeptide repeat protein [Oscillatoriophycideae cyanobacterium NC_groundwater_1537_Pr4_S-0.65um_50_18]|nr:tetratricopeptide repeat protein [Oscillatoriophycideae cyanobacterium NC_groundwater_1537_Pr4_S-0.65um_50_18]